jgi:hypothetical protein
MKLIGFSARGKHRIRKKLTTWGVAAVAIGCLSVGAVGAVASSAPASATVQGGTCNAFAGAKPLGAAYTDSSVTVPACGPQPYLTGVLTTVRVYPGGPTTKGYQCAEFSQRYLYYKYGVKLESSTNGDQMVDHYASWYPSLFTKYSNGTVGHAPVKGDVLSFSDVSTFNGASGGHTAVVQSSSVNSDGSGSITIVEENGGKNGATGSQVLTVSGWKVQYSPHPYVKWLHYKGSTATQPAPPASTPPAYHAGRQVKIAANATTGVSGHTGPGNTYASNKATGANQPLWIVCYVTGQSITNSYYEDKTTIWDLSDNGYYYSDAWVVTGSSAAVVPACRLKSVTVDKYATGGLSGHTGPGNNYTAGPLHGVNTPMTIACYVTGQSITNSHYNDTTTIWDLAVGGYYYSDAWLYTGTNGAAVPHC